MKEMKCLPLVTHAKNLAEKFGAQGVLIIALDDSSISGASYGATARKCAALGRVLDSIVDGLSKGSIDLPEEFYD